MKSHQHKDAGFLFNWLYKPLLIFPWGEEKGESREEQAGNKRNKRSRYPQVLCVILCPSFSPCVASLYFFLLQNFPCPDEHFAKTSSGVTGKGIVRVPWAVHPGLEYPWAGQVCTGNKTGGRFEIMKSVSAVRQGNHVFLCSV